MKKFITLPFGANVKPFFVLRTRKNKLKNVFQPDFNFLAKAPSIPQREKRHYLEPI
jgi:hypothetical protein